MHSAASQIRRYINTKIHRHIRTDETLLERPSCIYCFIVLINLWVARFHFSVYFLLPPRWPGDKFICKNSKLFSQSLSLIFLAHHLAFHPPPFTPLDYIFDIKFIFILIINTTAARNTKNQRAKRTRGGWNIYFVLWQKCAAIEAI